MTAAINRGPKGGNSIALGLGDDLRHRAALDLVVQVRRIQPFGQLGNVALTRFTNQSDAMRSETAKLPRGQSYPLKPSALADALAGAGIRIDAHLIRRPGDLFDAHFWPPNDNVPHERLYVRAGSVSAERAARARHQVEEMMLPRLVEWIGGLLSADARSPMRREQQALDLGPL